MAFTKFLLLFFIFPFVSAALVAPPTNITLTCRNLRNILSWDYENDVPGLQFHVRIRSDSGCRKEMWFNESSRQADLSFLSNPDSTYLVTLKAVHNESTVSPEEEIEFSYFSGTLGSQKCLLDIPPVDITTLEHHHIQVQFKHPWLVYKDGLSGCKTQKKKKNYQENTLPVFKCTVQMVGKKNKSHTFYCEDAVCEIKLQVDMEQDKHCLKINGELEMMTVQSTKEFCTQKAPPPLNHIALVVGITVAVIAAVAFVATMFFWKKTRPTEDKLLPSILKIFHIPKKPACQLTPDDASPVTVGPLLISHEEPPMETIISQNSDEDYDQRTKLSPNNQVLSEEPEDKIKSDDQYRRELNFDGDLEEPNLLEPDPDEPNPDELIRSPYECRGAVVLELAPEDHAEGYRS